MGVTHLLLSPHNPKPISDVLEIDALEGPAPVPTELNCRVKNVGEPEITGGELLITHEGAGQY